MGSENNQTAEEALTVMLRTGCAAAFAGLKDMLNPYIKSVLTETNLKGFFRQSLHKKTQVVKWNPGGLGCVHTKGVWLKDLLQPLATFVKKKMNIRMIE